MLRVTSSPARRWKGREGSSATPDGSGQRRNFRPITEHEVAQGLKSRVKVTRHAVLADHMTLRVIQCLCGTESGPAEVWDRGPPGHPTSGSRSRLSNAATLSVVQPTQHLLAFISELTGSNYGNSQMSSQSQYEVTPHGSVSCPPPRTWTPAQASSPDASYYVFANENVSVQIGFLPTHVVPTCAV